MWKIFSIKMRVSFVCSQLQHHQLMESRIGHINPFMRRTTWNAFIPHHDASPTRIIQESRNYHNFSLILRLVCSTIFTILFILCSLFSCFSVFWKPFDHLTRKQLRNTQGNSCWVVEYIQSFHTTAFNCLHRRIANCIHKLRGRISLLTPTMRV